MLKDMSDHKISDDELIPQIMCLPKAVSEIFSTPSNQLKMQCSFRGFFFFAFTYLIIRVDLMYISHKCKRNCKLSIRAF